MDSPLEVGGTQALRFVDDPPMTSGGARARASASNSMTVGTHIANSGLFSRRQPFPAAAQAAVAQRQQHQPQQRRHRISSPGTMLELGRNAPAHTAMRHHHQGGGGLGGRGGGGGGEEGGSVATRSHGRPDHTPRSVATALSHIGHGAGSAVAVTPANTRGAVRHVEVGSAAASVALVPDEELEVPKPSDAVESGLQRSAAAAQEEEEEEEDALFHTRSNAMNITMESVPYSTAVVLPGPGRRLDDRDGHAKGGGVAAPASRDHGSSLAGAVATRRLAAARLTPLSPPGDEDEDEGDIPPRDVSPILSPARNKAVDRCVDNVVMVMVIVMVMCVGVCIHSCGAIVVGAVDRLRIKVLPRCVPPCGVCRVGACRGLICFPCAGAAARFLPLPNPALWQTHLLPLGVVRCDRVVEGAVGVLSRFLAHP